MTQTVFFSWQADIESRVGRGLIEDALKKAIKALAADAEVNPADRDLAVDRDRKGVPGTPPLMETIFGKIDVSTAFLSDLTYVGARDDGRRTPNPNVLMEHGWALKAVTWRAMISVMNTAYGHPDDHALPFDLQHFARPIFFHCPADADTDTKAKVRDDLAKSLRVALREILKDEQLKTARRPAAPEAAHPEDLALVESPSADVRVETGVDARQWWSVGLPKSANGLNPETSWRMRLVRPGLLEYETRIGQRIDDDREILVSGYRLEALVVRHFDRMSEILMALGFEGPALAQISLDGVEDVVLGRPRGVGRKMGQPVLPLVRMPALQARLADTLRETLDMIWLSGGWADGSPSFGAEAWEGYGDCVLFRLD